MRRLYLVILVSVLSLLGGCAGTVRHMQPSMLERTAVVKPDSGKSLLIFLRPSGLGFAVQSSVFKVNAVGNSSLVGIVAAKMKVAYQVEPGQHLFMAIGESAEFMSADVQAGKTYYIRVEPRMGMWKARFALEPVKATSNDLTGLTSDLADCSWVEKTEESERWARENMSSVESKRAEYYPKWQAEAADRKVALAAGDGR